MTQIPSTHIDILKKKSYAHVATIDSDGSPQVTPVWVDYEDGEILINSAVGRKKDRNLRNRPQVAVSVQDPENPYRYLGIQGKVTAVTEQGAEAHIHKLSHKYSGVDFPLTAGETRVIYKISPERVWTMG